MRYSDEDGVKRDTERWRETDMRIDREKESMVYGKREREKSQRKRKTEKDSEGPGLGIGRQAHLFIHSIIGIY